MGTIPAVPAAEMQLLGEARSAGAARRFLATTLSDWNASSYDDAALLLVSELVANAALHARTEVSVRIELMDSCLRLEVTDLSPRQPVVRRYSAEATTGRGLGLVEALAERWGIVPHASGGKTVWVELAQSARPRSRHTEAEVDLSLFPDLEDEQFGDSAGGPVALGRAA